MKRFFNLIRNVLAVFGLMGIIGLGVAMYVLLKSTSQPPRTVAQKVLERAGLESAFLAALVERKPARPEGLDLPPLDAFDWMGHGASLNNNLLPVVFNLSGLPVPRAWLISGEVGSYSEQSVSRTLKVNTASDFLSALGRANPGDAITLSPGSYTISRRTIPVNRPGTVDEPIVVRAERVGEVSLELDTLEGFLVSAPYWIFENLEIKGVCSTHSRCEHAFHVVGSGNGFVLRNSRVSDFNAAIKANAIDGSDGQRIFPDGALIKNNTFYNTSIRNTRSPVVPLDLVGTDHWVIRGNIIADFSKGQGDQVSTGAFIKGNSSNGVFENNLVVCEYSHSGGVRLGLSFGGGGTGSSAARDHVVSIEHTGGLVRNNVVMNCSDVGLYLNKARKTTVLNNIFYRTMGIDVRFEASSAVIFNNILDGRIRSRDGGTFIENNNLITGSGVRGMFRPDFKDLFVEPDRADFRLLKPGPVVAQGIRHDKLKEDICGHNRGDQPDLGPFEYSEHTLCRLLDF
ncbi:right-handed parallel beta-helix repeat-containing protein [Desulfonatronovibrio hydrogenovorans]|uniref:right-handed parallel beta-helix repeat-containing protein n=1 Tax=Desulfonatronovibrio hydrogenovorans TaxID=53245 RepID=UPI00068C9220|nr:right-handed parallel beta-helix repeat-containing protein [Desulfonatronovibrio hydrogenovorans]